MKHEKGHNGLSDLLWCLPLCGRSVTDLTSLGEANVSIIDLLNDMIDDDDEFDDDDLDDDDDEDWSDGEDEE